MMGNAGFISSTVCSLMISALCSLHPGADVRETRQKILDPQGLRIRFLELNRTTDFVSSTFTFQCFVICNPKFSLYIRVYESTVEV